ncbi:MAG: GspH/FimT family pseudopilin [Pseudomonadota bacterium]
MREFQAHRQRGFTLTELIVTMSLVAVLAAMAAPSFSQMLANQRVRAAAYNIVSDMVLARSEAVKRGESIVMTPSGSGWTGGWSVTVVSSSEVLGGQPKMGSGVTLTTVPSTLASVTFDLNGRVPVGTAIRFGLSDGGTSMRCITLDPSGRPKSASTVCPT